MWIEFYDISEPTLPSCGNGTRLHMWNVNLKILPLWWGLAYMAQLLWICWRLPPQENFLKLLRDVIDYLKLHLTDRWIPGHIRTFTVIQWNWNSSTHMNRKKYLTIHNGVKTLTQEHLILKRASTSCCQDTVLWCHGVGVSWLGTGDPDAIFTCPCDGIWQIWPNNPNFKNVQDFLDLRKRQLKLRWCCTKC